MTRLFISLGALVALGISASACAGQATDGATEGATDAATEAPVSPKQATKVADAKSQPMTTDFALFAGGCFWCVEADFEKLDGVYEAISGYAGGDSENPTYKNHKNGGHREVARITFDPTIVSYRQLADYFFRSVDPLDAGGQFCDRGAPYTTAIYALNDEQRQDAEAAKALASAELGQEVVTPILGNAPFWPAEDYHQDYYKKKPVRYKYYRNGCGRDKRIAQIWKK